MTDTKDTDNTGRRPLTLKRADTGTVKQSFSHGRKNTVVVEVKRRRILGKPEDACVAAAFLTDLGGRRHQVITAIAVRRGDRVAQIVFSRTLRARLEVVPELEGTPRGEGGFGHTGR